MHVPPKADYDTQKAIQEIIDEIRTLKGKLASIKGVATQAELDDLRRDMIKATQRPQTLDFQDVMRGAGSPHSLGYAPDPGPFAPMDSIYRAGSVDNGNPETVASERNAGDLRVLHEDGLWKFVLDGLLRAVPAGLGGASVDQRVVNVLASMAVLNGLSADQIFCREAYVYHIPYCIVKRTSVQTFTTGVQAAINFDVEDIDTDGMHDNVTNNTRITLNRAGLWMASAAIRWAGNATGFRRMIIRRTGSFGNEILASTNWETVTAIAQDMTTPTVVRRCSAGDYLEVEAVQSSGGNLDVQATAALSPYFWAYWLAM